VAGFDRVRFIVGMRSRVAVVALAVALVASATPAATAAVLNGADGSTIPRQPLITAQELGKGSVDGLQYGNPTDGLTLVQPPEASSDGGAHLTYPLLIPKGRGIQPQLDLSYNSAGNDTWAGLNWDLSVGDVSVDTRWGVPRFDPNKETESYTLNGDPLVPNGLDGSRPRVKEDRQDFTRQTETQFAEITRVYSPPGPNDPQQDTANYYWRVRDKMGDVFWYGGFPDQGGPFGALRTDASGNPLPNGAGNGIDRSAIVTDENGNQVHWLLSAERDVGVNLIKYHYTTVHYKNEGTGWVRASSCTSDDSTMCAQHTYLSGIEYTAAAQSSGQSEDAPYHVQFLRDSDLHPDENVRSDAPISAIGGYLDLTADRLAQVNVYYQPPIDGGERVYSGPNKDDGLWRDAPSPDTFVEADPAAPTAKLMVRYDLNYDTGPFGKSRLTSVSQVGSDATTTATHTFKYFDDVATQDATTHEYTYHGFSDQKWSQPSDGLNRTSIDSNAAGLGASETNSGEGHFYLGFNPLEPEKEGSFGGALKVGGGDTSNRVEWLDLNGDGLPDKVVLTTSEKDSNGNAIPCPCWRKNLGVTGGMGSFGDAVTIDGLTDGLSAQHNFNFQVAIEAFFGVTAAFGVGATYNWADKYFIDVNGDGLPDFVDSGHVYFNHLDKNGNPTFTEDDSSQTPVPINTAAATGADDAEQAQIKSDLAAQSPLVDTVRRWTAPYSGKVTINAPVTLSPPSGITSVDGVRVAIQQNATELDHATLTNAGDTAFTTPMTEVKVAAGDRVYFRVGSIDNGAGDQVTWNPAITYTAIDNTDLSTLPLDENQLDRTSYSSLSDFTTAGRPGAWVNMPNDGTVKFVATVYKSAVTSDDLKLVLKHNDVVVPQSDVTIPWWRIGNVSFDVPAFDVKAPVSTTDPSTHKTTTTTDRVSAYLAVNSQIDVTKISWHPQLQYTAATQKDANGNPQAVGPTDLAAMVIDVPPEIEQYPFHATADVQQQWTAGSDASYNAVVTITHHIDTPAGTAWLSVKSADGTLVAQAPVDVDADNTPDNLGVTQVTDPDKVVQLNVALKKDQKYWFDLTMRDPLITTQGSMAATVKLRPTDANDDKQDFTVPSDLAWQGRSGIFPIPYRGWAVAGYNGDGGRATQPLNEDDFVIHTDSLPNKDDQPTPGGYEDPNFKQAQPDKAYAYLPVVQAKPLTDTPEPNQPPPLSGPMWEGTRANLAASGDTMRSSRLGSDSIDTGATTGVARAVDRTSISGPQFSATAGIGPASVAFSVGPTFGLQDFMDMNGDGIPDVLTPGKIQYTHPRGNYDNPSSVGPAHTSQDLDLEVDPGVSAGLISLGPGKSAAHASNAKGGKDGSDKPGAGVGSFGFGNSIAWHDPTTSDSGGDPDPTSTYSDQLNDVTSSKKGSDVAPTAQAFADVNGDGLPDLILSNSSGNFVRYNLGYGFTKASFKLSGGGYATSNSYGANISGGFMMPDGSFSGGVTFNWNYSYQKFSWQDVNGDGILDRITKGAPGDSPTVAFGTGTGLLPDVPFGTFEKPDTIAHIDPGEQANFTSTNQIGGSLDVTIGIPCAPFCNIIIGVGASYQNSSSAPEVALQDVNGDGYPDSVKTSSDGDFEVRTNNTGRTNLLQQVTTPLGETISLDYNRVGNTPAQPQSVWTMSKVDVNDGHPGDEAACTNTANTTCPPYTDVIRRTFTYSGGRYDRLFKTPLGFDTIVQNDVDPTACAADSASDCGTILRTTTSTFTNNNVFDSGLQTGSTLTDANGTTLKTLTNNWTLMDVNTGAPAVLPAPTDPVDVNMLGRSVAPLLTRSDATTYANGVAGPDDENTFAYDSRGNLLTQTDYGQPDNPNDDVVANYTYSSCQIASSTQSDIDNNRVSPGLALNPEFGCGQSSPSSPNDVHPPPKIPGAATGDPSVPIAATASWPPLHPSPLYSPDECQTYVSLPVVIDITNGKSGGDKVTYRHRDGRQWMCDNASVTKLDESAGDGTTSTTLLSYDSWGNYNRIVYPPGENGNSLAVEYFYDHDVGHNNVATVNQYQLTPSDAAAFVGLNYSHGKEPDSDPSDPAQTSDPFDPTQSPLAYSSSATFDPLSQQELTSTDPNNIVTNYTYDALGRISTVSTPRFMGVPSPTPGDPPLVPPDPPLVPGDPPLVTYSYDLSTPGNASATAHNYDYFHPNDPIDTVAFVDGTGRVTQDKRDAAVFTQAGQPAAVGTVVSGHVDYDALGRPVQQYNPYYSPGPIGAFDTTKPPPAAPVTTTEYDLLDRTTKTIEPPQIDLPGPRVTTTRYDFGQVNGAGPQLFRSTEVDPAQHSTTYYSNVRGIEIASIDTPATNDPALLTQFQSDGMGQLTKVIDSAGNQTTNTYDWMGRRTSTNTPDGGLINYGYDAQGNLITEQTPNERAAKQPATHYSYQFGQVTEIDTPGAPTVTYSYGSQNDPNAEAAKAVGRVMREEDGSRIQTLEYNATGQVTKQVADMKVHNWTPATTANFRYTTQWSYDGFGRLKDMTYPDGEKLNYGYDAGGQVNSIGGVKTTQEVVGTNPDGTPIIGPVTRNYPYLNDRQYDVFLHRRFDQLGNSVTTEDTYDPGTQWLTRQLTKSPLRPTADTAHQTIQDLNYTYDAAGNPTSYVNNLPAPVSNLFGGKTTENYTYDGYYRLKTGTGMWQNSSTKSEHYTFALNYDTNGNVVSKNQYDAVTVNGKDNPVAATTYNWTRSYTSSPAPHQAVSDSTTSGSSTVNGTYSYDADGNFLGLKDSKGKWIRSLTYDATNEMREINDSNGDTTYAYDDAGNLRIERGPSGETAFVNQWVTVLNGGVMYKHIWAGDDRIATQKVLSTGEESRYFLHKDLQGSTNMVTDQTGKTFQHNEYFPTGENWITENSTIFRTPYQYAGGYTDVQRQTIDMGSRWYDQAREMFYSPDPALADSSAVVTQPSIRAAYSFAGSNALANTDASGDLFATVNKTYAEEMAKSREQIVDIATNNGDNGKDFFKSEYGRIAYALSDVSGNSIWGERLPAFLEHAAAPVFTFQFRKNAATGRIGVTLSLFEVKDYALNETAERNIAADLRLKNIRTSASAPTAALTKEAAAFESNLKALFSSKTAGGKSPPPPPALPNLNSAALQAILNSAGSGPSGSGSTPPPPPPPLNLSSSQLQGILDKATG
jgi:RHS repeat-associated protein